MLIEFDDDCTLRIKPENSIEKMALKYWEAEYEKHGDKVLDVDTDPEE